MARLTAAFLILAGAYLWGSVAISHAASIPADGRLNFSVMRKGEQIGTHVLSFRQSKDRLDVDIKTRIAVKFAFVTVYHFEHDGHEVWENGHLVGMQTKTDDDGTDHTLRVSTDGGGKLHVVGDGNEREADPNVIPASLWNPAFIESGELMNSLMGAPLDIKTQFRGEESVMVNGQPVRARHYSVTGELARELWYDRHGVLVQMKLTGKDGSAVAYVLN